MDDEEVRLRFREKIKKRTNVIVFDENSYFPELVKINAEIALQEQIKNEAKLEKRRKTVQARQDRIAKELESQKRIKEHGISRSANVEKKKSGRKPTELKWENFSDTRKEILLMLADCYNPAEIARRQNKSVSSINDFVYGLWNKLPEPKDETKTKWVVIAKWVWENKTE